MPPRRAHGAKRQRPADCTCWAHTRSGARCGARVQQQAGGMSDRADSVPYCLTHLTAGDGALKRVRHPDPALGDALVARVPLPAGYRLCFWGDRTRRYPQPDRDDRTLQYMSGRERKNLNGVIDPAPYDGSLSQFMNAPGPSELPTVRPTLLTGYARLGLVDPPPPPPPPRTRQRGYRCARPIASSARTTTRASSGRSRKLPCCYSCGTSRVRSIARWSKPPMAWGSCCE